MGGINEMKRLFTSSELSKQRMDWHHALIQTEAGDKPYLIRGGSSGNYRTMSPGCYLIETQRNRNGAPITYKWISDLDGAKILALAETDRVAAEELMARKAVE